MAFQDQVSLAQHPGFRLRTLMATVKSAVAVAAEASSGDQRTDQLRADLATKVLNDPLGHEERFAWAVAQNAAVTFGSPDADIEFTVASIWNAMAGV